MYVLLWRAVYVLNWIFILVFISLIAVQIVK